MESRSAPPSPDEPGEAVFSSRCGRYPHPPSLQRTFASCRESVRPRPHHRHAASEPARPDDHVLTTAEVHDYPSSESGIAADCPQAHTSNADDSPSYDRSDYEGHSSYSLRHTPEFHHTLDCKRRPGDYNRSHTPDYSHGHGPDCERAHGRSQTSRRPHRKHRREEDEEAQSLDERCARDLDEILPARLAAVNLSREPPPQSWNRSNIAATMERFEPVDYSYAYYDHHLSMPSSSRKANRQRGRGGLSRDRSARHNYVTRYGTEENIYEEITDGSRTCPKHRYAPRQSLVSLDRSVVEEEVRRVESRHKRILGELNLSVEAMLMPECESPDSERAEDRDNIEELLRVGPTDELLSPASCNPPDLDSGFSGSSSGASYVGSLRRKPTGSVPHLPAVAYGTRGAGVRILGAEECGARCSRDMPSPRSSSCGDAKSSGFWNKKSWKKISGFSSSNSINKAGLTGLLVRYTFRRKSGSQGSQGKRRAEPVKCDACLSQRC
ncbi:uncharacterized protein LOC115456110 isoform X1 [Manduca sexta]|uniref:uncharacterized protein LOC115456110 isoform X1 n=1 Tax=Manduca sexta TaxID=7130 RepID=UPI00188E6A4E|nr:uncharacterized protein LOC115456110 isoform X1 [Manduca sexta]XP_030040863.2 uncharacterized protein LOC115456110 isoform X1 [Manduca sexta]XP_037294493.1 uncharacterized protein LOC115456110 isoform X1 [Manduca sexta]